MHQIQLEQFEGPLDLLLQLIEKNKLEITEISLAKITDQYLSYIDQADNLASTEIADFLLIASKLIYLKSKYLLPDFNLEDEDEAGDLEQQLKIYRQYYEASKYINKLFLNKQSFSYNRINPYKLPIEQAFRVPDNATKQSLAQIFREVLDRIKSIVNLPKAVLIRAISIGEKIKDIKELIKRSNKFNFKALLKNKHDKTEIVVNFLAMLELIKQREIVVHQECLFSDLNINKHSTKSGTEIEF